MNLPLSSDEVAFGRKVEEANKLYSGQVHAYKVEVQRLVDEQAALERERKPLKTPRAVVPVVHPVPCARCVKAKKPCVGKPGNSCELCKDACKKCEYSTHRHGVAKEKGCCMRCCAKAAVKGALCSHSKFLCGAVKDLQLS
ncbi:hypothetical protein DFJ58DRAFT_846336 [Suillus subalutaceus]|uniref:uncharacterized protein n=1 Tax=Suillus subalutaceus TaxID=48586 RepID=UPI001B871D1C|nr:uncharacterized protein DFJ58DRAFT_846336 [Suillus subalutaceus]KAG1837804.1 hypothetical protein DFJ58DRAFT_846336 [Suillus subalutaceus]